MARVNLDILGINELKRTGMGEFNQITIISTTVGKNPLEEWSSHHNQQKSLKCVLWWNLKNNRTTSVRFQGKPFNITVIQVYAPATGTEEAEVEQLYEDLQDLLELTPKKEVLFIIGNWNAN